MKKLISNRLQAFMWRIKSSLTRKRKTSPQIFILWDAIGDGRPIGVFTDENLVRKLMSLNPHYFRYYSCKLNFPLEKSLEWLPATEKEKLLEICEPFMSAPFSKPD